MTDFEKLNAIINEINDLISLNVTSSSPKFNAWHTKASRFLIAKFGEDSYEYRDFMKFKFSVGFMLPNLTEFDFIKACRKDLLTIKEIFCEYLKEIKEKDNIDIHKDDTYNDRNKIFIVHGHDGELKQAVARYVEKQGIEAIILHERANGGNTIIEKIESNSNVGAAICLFTADDIGRSNEEDNEKSRARQNVVFEAGYFIGKLGRNKVIILADEGIEIPSDLQGVVYTNSRYWQMDLLRELNSIGYAVNLNILL